MVYGQNGIPILLYVLIRIKCIQQNKSNFGSSVLRCIYPYRYQLSELNELILNT